jgi:hypothetical protein
VSIRYLSRRGSFAAVVAVGLCSGALVASPALAVPAPAKVSVSGAWLGGTQLYSLVGEQVRITGHTTTYAPGQAVKISLLSHGRVFSTRTVRLTPGASGTGRFTWPTRINRLGTVGIVASHAATAGLDRFAVGGPAIEVYSASPGFGHRSLGVVVLGKMLRSLGYWAPYGDSFGAGMGKAVLAFRKANFMDRIEIPSLQIYRMLQRGKGAMRARYPSLGVHLEADLTRQVLTFYDGAHPTEVDVISSGKPSTPTVLGRFQFYMQDLGTNDHGMVDSSYFHNGYAVHGYAELPTYAASHGCLRVWVPQARHIHDLIHVGETIVVFW